MSYMCYGCGNPFDGLPAGQIELVIEKRVEESMIMQSDEQHKYCSSCYGDVRVQVECACSAVNVVKVAGAMDPDGAHQHLQEELLFAQARVQRLQYWGCALWDRCVPEGMAVEVLGDDGVLKTFDTDQTVTRALTRSRAWQAGSGDALLSVVGVTGGYLLERIMPADGLNTDLRWPEPVPEDTQRVGRESTKTEHDPMLGMDGE